MHFLDRFVYRNAKKTATTKGQSIMQPLSGSRRDGGIMFTKGSGIKSDAIPLNSERFLQKKEDDVEADEVFFHKYFNQKAVTATKKSKKDKANADDEDGEEDEVWRAMMSSIPGGLDNEDDDEGLDNSDDDEEMRALLMSDDDEAEDGEGDMAEFESDQGEPMDDEDDEEGDIELELMNASSMDEEEDEQVEEPIETNKRSAFDEPSGSKKKKQKKEALPTFASYEDYAKLIEQDLSD